MKTWLQAKRELIHQWPIEHNTVEFTQKIDKLGLDIVYYPNKGQKEMVDYITEAIWWEYENWPKLYNERWDIVSSFDIAEIVLWLFYGAVEKITKNWNMPFIWYIKEADTQLKNYLNKKYDVKDKKKTYEVSNQQFIDILNWIDRSDVSDKKYDIDTLSRIEKKIDKMIELWNTHSNNETAHIIDLSKIDKPVITTPKIKKSFWKSPLVNSRMPK